MSDNRVSIPLRMLDGNLQVLLENWLPCQEIALRPDLETEGGVILMIRQSAEQKLANAELGFKTTKFEETEYGSVTARQEQ